jgi:hypothetical protein
MEHKKIEKGSAVESITTRFNSFPHPEKEF